MQKDWVGGRLVSEKLFLYRGGGAGSMTDRESTQ